MGVFKELDQATRHLSRIFQEADLKDAPHIRLSSFADGSRLANAMYRDPDFRAITIGSPSIVAPSGLDMQFNGVKISWPEPPLVVVCDDFDILRSR